MATEQQIIDSVHDLSHESEFPNYYIANEFRSTRQQTIIMASNYKEAWEQGQWFVDGVPMGGFNTHPIDQLDERYRESD